MQTRIVCINDRVSSEGGRRTGQDYELGERQQWQIYWIHPQCCLRLMTERKGPKEATFQLCRRTRSARVGKRVRTD